MDKTNCRLNRYGKGGSQKMISKLRFARLTNNSADIKWQLIRTGEMETLRRRVCRLRLSISTASIGSAPREAASRAMIPEPEKISKKEKLWFYLDEYTDHVVQYLIKVKRVPNIIHAHYADAGYVGSRVAAILNVPFVFTGHSLGRVKKERLLLEKGVSEKSLDQNTI